ncbi:hypothetical protein [Roseobacter sp. N2S]|uniref:hypothetical protein n=1 Tax=Roseobacter sp. N2S TaxID=2663844 RepID=UPI0028583BCB|nr:hypothetical protein [Roseobacter sp. N2S]MDR6266527.1 hypothetical protein [Roseobacter sp. N2S]
MLSPFGAWRVFDRGMPSGGGTPESPVLYAQNFETDRSADFNDTMTHYSGEEYPEDDYPAWLGTSGGGAMAFGGGDDFISSRYIDVDAYEGMVPEIYWVMDKNDIGGDGYITDNLVLRLKFSYLNAGGSEISNDYLGAPDYAGVFYPDALPAGTATLRIYFERRVNLTNRMPMVIYFLQVRDVTEGAVSPIPSSPLRLPWPWPVLAATGETISKNYGGTFDGAVSTVGVGDAPANLGLSAAGKSITFTPTEAVSPAEPCYITAQNGDTQGLAPAQIYVMAEDVSAMSLRALVHTMKMEAGHALVVDPVYYVEGGLWPYSVSITSAPSWMDEHSNGVLTGVASGTGAQTSVVATVTDALGDTIEVTVPVEIISISRASPTALNTGGDLKVLSGVHENEDEGVGPKVFQLADGETYTSGNWFKVNRGMGNPVIFMGPDTGMAYIDPGMLNQCHGLWFEGNITFLRTTLPSGNVQSSLSERTDNDWGFSALNSVYWPTNGEPRSHNRWTGVTFEGYETDLSNETGWMITLDGEGNLQYDAGGTLPTTGPESRGVYRGGIELSTLGVAQDCEIKSSAHPIRLSGPQSLAFNNRLSRTRVDNIRIHGADGCAVIGNRNAQSGTDTRTNCRSDEHQDHIQSVNDNDTGAGLRCVFVDNFLIDLGWVGVQAIQLNMGSAGSYDDDGDPRGNAYDWMLKRNVMTASLSNGVNPQGFIASMSDNMIVTDPETFDLDNATYAITRRDGNSMVNISNNVLTNISADTSVSAWTLSGNLVFAGPEATDLGATSITDIFPNINTVCTYNDPREAVENGAPASEARFYRNNSAGYTQGAAWLTTG